MAEYWSLSIDTARSFQLRVQAASLKPEDAEKLLKEFPVKLVLGVVKGTHKIVPIDS
jgi:hypothetical protein